MPQAFIFFRQPFARHLFQHIQLRTLIWHTSIGMHGESDSDHFEKESVVKDDHIHRGIWAPMIGEELTAHSTLYTGFDLAEGECQDARQ